MGETVQGYRTVLPWSRLGVAVRRGHHFISDLSKHTASSSWAAQATKKKKKKMLPTTVTISGHWETPSHQKINNTHVRAGTSNHGRRIEPVPPKVKKHRWDTIERASSHAPPRTSHPLTPLRTLPYKHQFSPCPVPINNSRTWGPRCHTPRRAARKPTTRIPGVPRAPSPASAALAVGERRSRRGRPRRRCCLEGAASATPPQIPVTNN